jgi:cholesterol oxidase
MGRDIPDGVLSLQDGRLAVDWTLATSAGYFGKVRKTMADIAGELGGDFVDNPLWWAKRVITVHPIGGAPAGRNPAEGVCDAYGEVFGYPGMFVVDGAAMPGPVGANPSLTIAAFAERACRRLLEGAPAASRGLVPETLHDGGRELGAVTDSPAEPRILAPDATKGKAAKPERPAPAKPDPASPATTRDLGAPSTAGAGATSVSFTSVSFTEQMHGWFSPGESDPAKGLSLGRDRDRRIMFELTITAPDIDAFVADPLHRASAEGYVLADRFGGRMPVEKGWFKQFVADASSDGRPARRMHYRLWLRDPGGTPLTFTGHKLIHNDAGLDSWADTTTLYATIVRGHVPPPDPSQPPSDEWASPPAVAVAGAGILRIRPLDFARQLTTFRAVGPEPLPALAAFGNFFLGELWRVYGNRARR